MTPSSDDQDPLVRIGEVVDERYELMEHLGSGGMAAVYRAEHVRTRAPFAIKVLHRELGDNAEIAARFQREALAARKIQHPNVVSALDFGRLPDRSCFMVLEYIRGEDLCMRLFREKPFAQPRAVRIALQVASALTAAHSAGIIHRDLKPDNIMLVDEGGNSEFVKVVDFGIAKLTAHTGQALTALGSVFGTPEYMAPEQARGTEVDTRTDLYTLGIVLYEMITGATPFADEAMAKVILGQISKPPPPLPATIDPELAQLIWQLLAKAPADRVQSAQELFARLHALLARMAPGDPLLTSVGAAPASRGPMPSSPRAPIVQPQMALHAVPVAPIAVQPMAPVPPAAPVHVRPPAAPNWPVAPMPVAQPPVIVPQVAAPLTPPAAANPPPQVANANPWVGLAIAVGVLLVLAVALAGMVKLLF